MNIFFIKHFFVGFMVSEIPRVSVFGHCPYLDFPQSRLNTFCYYSIFKYYNWLNSRHNYGFSIFQ